MGREDARPIPTTQAWRVTVGVEPWFWANNRHSRGCGYLYTRSWLVGDGWTCATAQSVCADLATHLREVLPTDLALSIRRAEAPSDPFTRCGHDVPCQVGYFPLQPGTAPRAGGKHDPWITWNLSGRHYDPTGIMRAGYTRIVIATSGAYPPAPGGRDYAIDTYPRWRTFVDYLAGHPSLFADKYGRKCEPADYVRLHRSSFYQK